eukprot:gene9070-16722_t
MGIENRTSAHNYAENDGLRYLDGAKSGYYQDEREKLVSSEESEDEVDIDTLLQRPNASCHQQFTDFSNVFKAFIGSALIGLPFAIRNAGIALGLLGILFIALATDHCCHLIVKCKRLVIKKMCQRMVAEGYVDNHIERQEKILGRTLSFGQIGKISMGRLGTFLVNTSILITQFGFCVGYFIFLGNTTRSVVYEFLHYQSIGWSNVNNSIPANSTIFTSLSATPPTSVPAHVAKSVLHNSALRHLRSMDGDSNIPALTSINTTLFNSSKSVFSKNSSDSSNYIATSTPLLNLSFPATSWLTNETKSENATQGIMSRILTTIHEKVSKIKEHIIKMKNPITHKTLQQNKAMTFALLLAVPAPLLILISFIRNLRKLGPVSVLANGAITGAFLATGIYILVGFESPHETINWFNWMKFPVFFGQVTGAFEGIGTVSN